MSEATRAGGPAATDPSMAEDLTVVREQTRETLELVRSLVGMLLPKDDGDGPKLEEVIAAVAALLRDVLIATRQIQSDQQAILKLLAGNGMNAVASEHTNGNARI